MPKKKKDRADFAGSHSEFGLMGGSDDEDGDEGVFVANPMKKADGSKPKTPRGGKNDKKKKKKTPTRNSVADVQIASSESDDENLAKQLAARSTPTRSENGRSHKSGQKKKKNDTSASHRSSVADIEIAGSDSDEENLAAQLAARSSSSAKKASVSKDLLMSNPMHEFGNEGGNEFLEKANSESGSSQTIFKGWAGIPNGKKGKKEKMQNMFFCMKGTGLVWAVEIHESEKLKAVPKKSFGLSGAKLVFNAENCAGTPLHALKSAKGGVLLFGVPDETALGEVDVRTGARSFDTTPIAALSKFVEAVMDSGTPVVRTDGSPIDIPLGDEDDSCTYFHDDIDPPQIIYIEVDGRLQVQDAFGPVAKAQGMGLGMLLRTVAGKRVAGMPLELVNQRIQDAEKPCEMVFVDDPDESSEEEEEEDDDDDIVECVFTNAGSIGIVFDEGEEEDTVAIDSIKANSAAERYKLLRPGMKVKEVRGQSTEGLDFDAIIELITDKKRPLQIGFSF